MPDYCDDLGKAEQFSKFPDLKVIIDCTEIFTQKPSSLKANKEIYSNYKSHTTFKFLVAINCSFPSATISLSTNINAPIWLQSPLKLINKINQAVS